LSRLDDMGQRRGEQDQHRSDLRRLPRGFLQPIEARHHHALQRIGHRQLTHLFTNLPDAILVVR
jgi:hypothetical protein